jgi:hypothetical protein
MTERHSTGNNNWEIYKMNADGTGETRLTNNTREDCCPAWSPDGTRITWASGQFGGSYAIYVMDASGQNQTRLTFFPTNTESGFADWSPDGRKIVFEQEECSGCEPSHGTIYVMNADGSNQVRLLAWPIRSLAPVWSPDGQKIAFTRQGEGLFVMNPDASNQANLGVPAYTPDWQPLPPAGYARPKGATPLNVRLVQAYRACTSPNAAHGAPFDVSSCGPPAKESTHATTTPGDAAKMAGLVTLREVGESPINPSNGDQADVQVTASLTDVRNPDLSDYTGELRLLPTLRITDRQSGGTYAAKIHPATATDTPLGFTMACTTTADTTIGSTCSATTSADAVMPGVVREGKRSVWGLGQVRVYDGGADGDADTAGDNTLFATQGLFVP